MNSIHKFPLPITRGDCLVFMPNGAEILHISCQNNLPFIWAKVNIHAKLSYRKFRIFLTGEETDENSYGKYLGTVQINPNGEEGPPFVMHVYEDGEQ